jgi:hypothetical protein
MVTKEEANKEVAEILEDLMIRTVVKVVTDLAEGIITITIH